MSQARRSGANGVLYDGTVITEWPVLSSEGIPAFDKTRGFDMAVCAQPAAYETIAAVCGEAMDYTAAQTYVSGLTSSFTGVENAQVILMNASEDSTAAVNALLKAGKTVSLITEGQYQGSFLCAYADWQSVAGDYLLTGVVFGGVLYRIGEKVRIDFDGSGVVLFSRRNGRLISLGSVELK